MKAIVIGVYWCLVLAADAVGQGAPVFEVAAIRPAARQANGGRTIRMNVTNGRLDYANVTLDDVLIKAYGVKRNQIKGPDWIFTDRYDISARLPEGVDPDQVPIMLRTLLAERFQMSVEKQAKQERIYALLVDKSGPRLIKAESSEDQAPQSRSGMKDEGERDGSRAGMSTGANGVALLRARNITLEQFADSLSKALSVPVLNQTGITGLYDFSLEMPGDSGGQTKEMSEKGGGDRAISSDATAGPSIFTAVKKYGLRLESRKGPVDYIVVGKAIRVPTAN